MSSEQNAVSNFPTEINRLPVKGHKEQGLPGAIPVQVTITRAKLYHTVRLCGIQGHDLQVKESALSNAVSAEPTIKTARDKEP